MQNISNQQNAFELTVRPVNTPDSSAPATDRPGNSFVKSAKALAAISLVCMGAGAGILAKGIKLYLSEMAKEKEESGDYYGSSYNSVKDINSSSANSGMAIGLMSVGGGCATVGAGLGLALAFKLYQQRNTPRPAENSAP